MSYLQNQKYGCLIKKLHCEILSKKYEQNLEQSK